MIGKCLLCERDDISGNRHHLFPRTMHVRIKKRKIFDLTRLKETVFLCFDCHDKIHSVFSESDLAFKYNSIDKIKENENIIRFVDWIKTKNRIFKSSKRINRRK